MLAACSWEDCALLWSVETGELLRTFQPHSSAPRQQNASTVEMWGCCRQGLVRPQLRRCSRPPFPPTVKPSRRPAGTVSYTFGGPLGRIPANPPPTAQLPQKDTGFNHVLRSCPKRVSRPGRLGSLPSLSHGPGSEVEGAPQKTSKLETAVARCRPEVYVAFSPDGASLVSASSSA